MALLYRVLQNFDPNSIPDANLVISCYDYIVAYKTTPGIGKTQTIVIAYQDSSGVWLVGAEPNVMAKLPTPRVALQAWINALGLWHTWRVDGHNDEDFKNLIASVELPADVSTANPEDLGNGRFAVGGKATARCRLGPFRPIDIEVDTVWRGDKVEKSIAVSVDDVKRI